MALVLLLQAGCGSSCRMPWNSSRSMSRLLHPCFSTWKSLGSRRPCLCDRLRSTCSRWRPRMRTRHNGLPYQMHHVQLTKVICLAGTTHA